MVLLVDPRSPRDRTTNDTPKTGQRPSGHVLARQSPRPGVVGRSQTGHGARGSRPIVPGATLEAYLRRHLARLAVSDAGAVPADALRDFAVTFADLGDAGRMRRACG